METPVHSQTPPLWQHIQLAAQGLQNVRNGQSARAVVQGWPGHLRPGAQALLYHALRHLGMVDMVRQSLAPRKPPAQVDALLCIALAVLQQQESAESVAYDAFTVVDQTVHAARKNHRTQAQAGFLNACLRRFLRDRDAMTATAMQSDVAQWNHPQWWIQRLQQQYPGQWMSILQANNSRAPLTLRVNAAKVSRQEYLQHLQQAGIAAMAVQEAGVILAQAVDVRLLPGYSQGWFSVQDGGAQLAAPLLLSGLAGGEDAATGTSVLKVLDACAAPGGKTAHLLEYAQLHRQAMDLLALDVDEVRCQRIHENLQRLQLQATVIAADAAQPAQWQHHLKGDWLDAILLDAPCSASGIVRRHPDVRWLRRETDIPALAATQHQLLQSLWPLLRSGGRLLYCTCSVFHEEGQDQIARFLQQHVDARLAQPVQHLVPTTHAAGGQAPLPASDSIHSLCDHDGFFYALLEKQ